MNCSHSYTNVKQAWTASILDTTDRYKGPHYCIYAINLVSKVFSVIDHIQSVRVYLHHKVNVASLPPAYVVRWEGNSFTLFVCPHLGGIPISHNALQHFPECHEAVGGSGYPPRGGTRSGTPGGVWVPPQGGTRSGTPGGSGYTPRGVPGQVPPWGVRVPPRGGVPSQDNRRSTHYTAGGMPLAFMQEDFLV